MTASVSCSGQATPRQRWMAILARASARELSELLARHGLHPEHVVLKAPETGTVMIEGRAGGSGVRFNLGEATVTRCVVRVDGGCTGVSYALGTGKRKAELAALIDALLQAPNADQGLFESIVALATRQQQSRDQRSKKAAATKVEFFTLVRGDG